MSMVFICFTIFNSRSLTRSVWSRGLLASWMEERVVAFCLDSMDSIRFRRSASRLSLAVSVASRLFTYVYIVCSLMDSCVNCFEWMAYCCEIREYCSLWDVYWVSYAS
jgi:hypothetical protein